VRRSATGSWTTLAFALVLLASLAVLATLQYRWIDQVSVAQRQRLEASLAAAAGHFGEDFDREIARAFHYFMLHPPGDGTVEEQLAERYRLWQAGAPYPELVVEIELAEGGDGGEPRLWRFDPARERFAAAEWTPALAPARAWLEARGGPSGPGPGGAAGRLPQLVLDEVPALLVPAPGGALVVVGLDREFLTSTLPAELAGLYFAGGGGLDYDVALVTRSDPPAAIYRSDPSLPVERYLPGAAGADLFGLRWFHELAFDPVAGGDPFPRHGGGPPAAGHQPEEPGRGGMGGMGGGGVGHPAHLREPPGAGLRGLLSALPGGERWRLVVSPRAGSLEAAVAAARRRNLALSLGVLALLAGSVGVLAVSARRAQRLARQQLEFVAGVTHELHTPLTAICSAGENLADGVVADGAQVRRYGAMIRDAGRRLTGQVAQALELAGVQSGRQRYRFTPLAVADAVDAALADCRWEIEQAGVEVERDLPAELPPVAADAEALRRALRNLIGNAVKYGAAGGWIGVRARADGGAVTIAVEDRGPGIARRDLPHLFEPFYRGRAAAGAGSPAVAGSGLGLAVVERIVEAHGGKVGVEARAAGGSRFTLRLPAAREAVAASPGAVPGDPAPADAGR
jgi:signal transduction histidine kinase